MPFRPFRALHLAALAFVTVSVLPSCTPGGSEEGAIRRGDEAFARGDHSEALAEYRLALRQGERTVLALTRTAHAYARVGRIDQAAEHYLEAIAQDPTVADLAASDLLRVAHQASGRNDGIAAAAAVEAALEVRPGVSLTGLALPLARHFSRGGQFGQALSYYLKASQELGNDPEILFEMALVHEELGDCQRAVAFFEQVRDDVTVARRSEVDWHLGNCSFELALEARDLDEPEESLRLFLAMTELGEPRNRLGPAWFEIGELRAARGECAEAVRAFEQVQREELAGAFLIQRARDRVDEIRFRRGNSGPC